MWEGRIAHFWLHSAIVNMEHSEFSSMSKLTINTVKKENFLIVDKNKVFVH